MRETWVKVPPSRNFSQLKKFVQMRAENSIYLYRELLQLISKKKKKKKKIFHFTDKLSLHNMAASSRLRENVYPVDFFLKIFIFIILLLLYYWHRC